MDFFSPKKDISKMDKLEIQEVVGQAYKRQHLQKNKSIFRKSMESQGYIPKKVGNYGSFEKLITESSTSFNKYFLDSSSHHKTAFSKEK
mmetsp:Transcript_2900/g.2726  ORF Transcript_2900/g.2726 Transcript_2900/m.2726 type:complete len:89 (+) Transcript_2900:929-1195(+)